jgi:hypothetical protein
LREVTPRIQRIYCIAGRTEFHGNVSSTGIAENKGGIQMRKYKVLSKERLNLSTNGNPRFSILLQDVETEEIIHCKTKSDYAYNYAIENPEYRESLIAELTYTKTGNCYIERIGKVEQEEFKC